MADLLETVQYHQQSEFSVFFKQIMALLELIPLSNLFKRIGKAVPCDNPALGMWKFLENYLLAKIHENVSSDFWLHTANKGPVRILYKRLVPIYVFPEMKLCGLIIFKTELYCSFSQFHIHSVSDLYNPRTGLPILLQPSRQTDPGNTVCKMLTDTWM
jgi:hypothetical protein